MGKGGGGNRRGEARGGVEMELVHTIDGNGRVERDHFYSIAC